VDDKRSCWEYSIGIMVRKMKSFPEHGEDVVKEEEVVKKGEV